jgi:hypothetical protein
MTNAYGAADATPSGVFKSKIKMQSVAAKMIKPLAWMAYSLDKSFNAAVADRIELCIGLSGGMYESEVDYIFWILGSIL